MNTLTKRKIVAACLLFVGICSQQVRADDPEDWCGLDGNILAMDPSACTRGTCDEPSARDPWIAESSSPLLTVRLRFNVFCEDNGLNCAATTDQVRAQVQILDQAFAPHRIRFDAGEPPMRTINSSRFRHFCSNHNDTCYYIGPEPPLLIGEEAAMKTVHADDPDSRMNIYVVNVEAQRPFNGKGYFPWWPGATIVDGGVILDKDFIGGEQCGPANNKACMVLGHEIGHVLGLWHSFHGTTTDETPYCGVCWEYAQCAGTCTDPACDEVGDLCCDTPAAPRSTYCLPAEFGDACVPPGAYYSQSEMSYRNYMSYSRDGCWDRFSPQQSGRMRCWGCDELSGWIVGEDCDDNGVADACESQPKGACCRLTFPPVQIVCTNGVSEACCEDQGGEWHGGGSVCASIQCFVGANLLPPGGGEEE